MQEIRYTTLVRETHHTLSPWRIVATLIAVAVAIGVYTELSDAPITHNQYTHDDLRIVCASDYGCWE